MRFSPIAMVDNFVEVGQRFVGNLYGFLSIEIDLGLTFVSLAQLYRKGENATRFETSNQNARATLEAVDRLKNRLPPDLRMEIERQRSRLAEALSTL
jgi:hypothetical protein